MKRKAHHVCTKSGHCILSWASCIYSKTLTSCPFKIRLQYSSPCPKNLPTYKSLHICLLYIYPLPYTPSCRSAYLLKYRDNFTYLVLIISLYIDFAMEGLFLQGERYLKIVIKWWVSVSTVTKLRVQ